MGERHEFLHLHEADVCNILEVGGRNVCTMQVVQNEYLSFMIKMNKMLLIGYFEIDYFPYSKLRLSFIVGK